MSLLVMKFGGTSVGSAAAIGAVATITQAQLQAWDQVVAVVSAMSGVTDLLLSGANAAASGDSALARGNAAKIRDKHAAALAELLGHSDEIAPIAAQINALVDEFELLCHSIAVLGEASPRAMDAIGGMGERMSARLVAAALRARGTPAEAVDATELIVTTATFGSAVPINDLTSVKTQDRLHPLLEQGIVPVVTGFIGATTDGVTTTLGRGGSDYSGAIIGGALNADEVDIYTDVDGVMTTDPRLVPNACIIPAMSYTEMGELAYFGAKILHPRTVRPVVERGIPLRIRNTFNPSHPGTLVVGQAPAGEKLIKAVTIIRNMSMITVEGRGMIGVPGVAARTFGAVASVGANVLMISQASSEQSICFVTPKEAAGAVVRALESGLAQEIGRRDIDHINANNDVVIVTAVCTGMRERPGIAAQIFTALAAANINVIAIAQGSSETAVSVTVTGADGDAAVRAVHALAV